MSDPVTGRDEDEARIEELEARIKKLEGHKQALCAEIERLEAAQIGKTSCADGENRGANK